VTPIERATNAQLILDNEVLAEAFALLEERIVSNWKSSSPDQWKSRERMFEQLTALQDVKQQLETFIHTAAMETTAKGKHGRSEGYNV
jgi:hypothetical protein